MVKKKVLFSIFIMSFLLIIKPQLSSGYFGESIEEFWFFMQDNPEQFIIDVRDKTSYINGHIPGAVSIFYTQMKSNMAM